MKKTISIDFTMDWPQAFWMLCDALDIKDLVNSTEDLCIHGGEVCRKDKETGEYITVDDRADLFCALRNVLNALAPNLDFRSDPYITNWGDEYPTNGDMIRRMSDRELADFLGKFEDCRDDIFEWLISEAEAETEEEGS